MDQFIRHRPKTNNTESEVSNQLVIGIDPGTTCGIAMREPIGWWTVGQIGSLSVLYDILIKAAPEVIVCEKFVPQPRQKIVATALKFIGVAELYAEQYDVPVEFQMPSQAKNFVGDRMLRKNDLWIKAMPHGRDAIRHVIYYMNKLGETSYVDQLLPPQGSDED